MISFKVLGLRERANSANRNVVQLSPGDWDDYSFKTSFGVSFTDDRGEHFDLGTVKIGYKGQPKGWTRERLPAAFLALSDEWFSLGQDVDYYEKAAQLPVDVREQGTCLQFDLIGAVGTKWKIGEQVKVIKDKCSKKLKNFINV